MNAATLFAMAARHHGSRTCRGCGCTDERACMPLGCHWVLLDLFAPTGVCSTCAADMDWETALLASVGLPR